MIYTIWALEMKSQKLLVLEDMIKYKDKIKASIESGKTFIITGNASELFGSYIIDNDVKYDALGVFNYNSVHETFRIVGSVTFSTKLIKEKIIGFQNRCGVMNDIDKPLFKVISGTGSSINSKTEGIHYKNFYATYVFGPLLIRNPYFTNYILKNTKKDHEVLLYQEKSSYKFSPKKGYKESIEVTVLDNEMLNPLWEHKLNKEYEKLFKNNFMLLVSNDDTTSDDVLVAYTEINRIKEYLLSLRKKGLKKEILETAKKRSAICCYYVYNGYSF